MPHPRLIWMVAQVVALLSAIGGAQAFDETKYPNLKGQWTRFIVRGVPGPPSFDQTKGNGLAQRAPLTPEYQKILEDSVADQRAGGRATTPSIPAVSPPGCPG